MGTANSVPSYLSGWLDEEGFKICDDRQGDFGWLFFLHSETDG
jgi:hypothetical protein